MEKRQTGYSFLLLCILALLWGGSFFLAEIALREMPPLTIALHRVFWAWPVLGLIVWARGIPIPRTPRIWGAYLVMGALNNAIPFSLIFWGQVQITSGLASILNATAAMFAAVVAGILLRDEPLTWNRMAGAVLGLLGVAFIMGPAAISELNPTNLAQLAILGATLSYAFAGVWGRTALSSQSPLMNAFGMLIGGTVLMVPIVLLNDGLPRMDLQPGTWAAVLALSIGSSALAYILYFAIMAQAGAANLMLVTLLIPPFAIALGVAFLGEMMTSDAWIGFAIIALGFAVTDGRIFRRGVRR